MGITVVIAGIAVVDGGATSPLIWLIVLTLAYAGLAYPPLGVGVMGMVMVSAYLAVAQSAGDIDHVIEFALSWDYLTGNPDGYLPTGLDLTSGVQLRLSQSFGYSVGGGALYGDE